MKKEQWYEFEVFSREDGWMKLSGSKPDYASAVARLREHREQNPHNKYRLIRAELTREQLLDD